MTLLSDLRYAVRSLARTPALTAALLFAVAIGVGSYATIAGFGNGLQRELSTVTSPEGQFTLLRLQRLLAWLVGIVLVTAAANVAGLLLSRAWRRTHETATRAALGATTQRLAAHIAADSIVIAVGGGLLGALVAYWTATAFPALLYSEDAERLRMAGSAGLVARAMAVYAAAMMLCALAPISLLRRQGPMAVLRRSGDGGATAVGRLRSVIVSAQISSCVLLVLGSAVLLLGFRNAVRTLRAERIGQPVIAILEARAGFARPDLGREYFAAVEHTVSRIPGVTGIVWTSSLPGAKLRVREFVLEQPRTGAKEVVVDTITSHGAQVMAQERIAGRLFGGSDGQGTCLVAIANEAAANEYFGGAAVGREIAGANDERIDIIGVVRPMRMPQNNAAEAKATSTLYFYERQLPDWAGDDPVPRRFRVPLVEAAQTARAPLGVTIASAGYLHAMNALLVSGSDYAGVSPDGCGVGLVNREAADSFAGQPVGGAVIDSDGQRTRIIGVTESPVLRVVERTAGPAVYVPFEQVYSPAMTLIALTDAASPELVAQIDAQLQGIDGAATSPQVMTLEERLLRTALGPERIAMALTAVCAALALALGVIGVYGVMADTVRARQREIALRLALGAPASRIVYLVFRDGIRLAGAGAVIGIAAAWLVLRLVLHADDGFTTPPLWVWAACPVVLFVMVAIASIGPARWALAVNPLAIARES
jgi:ABC-type lipoprotein release transport system permease subunit